MSGQSKVTCQCCGMLMVPTVTRTKGVFVGWKYGWRFGGGWANGSVCPFCMSENWDDASRPVHRPVLQKFVLLAVVMLSIGTAYSLFSYFGTELLGLSFSAFFQTAAEWSFVIIGVMMYQRHKLHKRN